MAALGVCKLGYTVNLTFKRLTLPSQNRAIFQQLEANAGINVKKGRGGGTGKGAAL